MFNYGEEAYKTFLNTNSLSGITGNTTNKIWADFDSNNLDESIQDAKAFCQKLRDLKLKGSNVQIFFSGNKGIHVVVETDAQFSQEQAKAIPMNIGQGLKTLDTKVYDNQRIFRLPFTVNEKSGLFKIPLTYTALTSWSESQIKTEAKDGKITPTKYEIYTPSQEFLDLGIPKEIKKSVTPISSEFSLDGKPKWLSNCRWSLQNGFFGSGERNQALVCLAAKYKNEGFDLDHVYRLLKGVAAIQGKRNNTEKYSNNEIYNNIVMPVFGPSWKGGQYSCRTEGWLFDHCQKLGKFKCNHKKDDESKPKTLVELSPTFKYFVTNIEQNTILTGIPSIDKNVFISTGANVGLLGAPSSGKTAIALEILRNTSIQGVDTVFASLDMNNNRMFEKIGYKLTGLPRKDFYQMFKDNKEGPFLDQLKENFGNVNFFSKSSPTVDDVKNYILNCQEEKGRKIKLVMLDYFERVSSDFSDDTAASKNVSGQLQDLVNELDIALVTIVQPNKFALSGGPDCPIYDYTKIKGSSFLYQSFRIIMSCWRPFYSPKDFAKDKYMQMAVLKNDLGELGEFAFKWEGKRGDITELDDYQYDEFFEFLRQKNEKKGQGDGGWN